jgi:hypothetical protein
MNRTAIFQLPHIISAFKLRIFMNVEQLTRPKSHNKQYAG